jgi:hypothetical protein
MKGVAPSEPYQYSCFGSCVSEVRNHKTPACLLYVTIMALFVVVMIYQPKLQASVGYSILGAHLFLLAWFVTLEVNQKNKMNTPLLKQLKVSIKDFLQHQSIPYQIMDSISFLSKI